MVVHLSNNRCICHTPQRSSILDFVIQQQLGSHYIFRALAMSRGLQFGCANYQFIELQTASFKICNDLQCMISNGVNTDNNTQIIAIDILLFSEQFNGEYESKCEAFSRLINLSRFNRLIICNSKQCNTRNSQYKVLAFIQSIKMKYTIKSSSINSG